MEGWTFLMQAYNDVEAGIVSGMLETASIPVRRKESDPLAGAMRVVGGQAYEIDLYVPEEMLSRARALLASLQESENENGENR
ncbi:MAG: hypothetical protein GX881_01650 [Firmicutes bacterium]|nr:hypothetical protein [Bacillota bacterium]